MTLFRATSHRSVALSFHTCTGRAEKDKGWQSCRGSGRASQLTSRSTTCTAVARCQGQPAHCTPQAFRSASQLQLPSSRLQNRQHFLVAANCSMAHLRRHRVLLYQGLLGEVDLQHSRHSSTQHGASARSRGCSIGCASTPPQHSAAWPACRSHGRLAPITSSRQDHAPPMNSHPRTCSGSSVERETLRPRAKKVGKGLRW